MKTQEMIVSPFATGQGLALHRRKQTSEKPFQVDFILHLQGVSADLGIPTLNIRWISPAREFGWDIAPF